MVGVVAGRFYCRNQRLDHAITDYSLLVFTSELK